VVADVVKRASERVRIDAAEVSAHSLRSGLSTTAARNGASERSIMKQMGHRQVATVRRRSTTPSCSTTTLPASWVCKFSQ
jgi:integrase